MEIITTETVPVLSEPITTTIHDKPSVAIDSDSIKINLITNNDSVATPVSINVMANNTPTSIPYEEWEETNNE